MTDSLSPVQISRNISIYAVAVGALTAGALGLISFLELADTVAALLFVLGLVLVFVVHEFLGGLV